MDVIDRTQHELDIVLKEVKQELQNMFTKKRVLIVKLGEAFESAGYDVDNVCQEIKNALRNEIAKDLIKRRLIEFYCLDKWKKKTKPKKEKENVKISFPEKNVVQPMIIETSGRVTPETQNVESRYNHSNRDTDKEPEEIELDEIDPCNIKNTYLDTKYNNNKEHLEFEITIPTRLVRKYILDPLHKQTERNNLLIHGTIDNRSLAVISAWVTGVQETSENGNTEQ